MTWSCSDPREFARLRNYADVSGKRQQQYQSIFQPVVAS